MCRLLETIRITDGIPWNLVWHEARMSRSVKELRSLDKRFILHELLTIPQQYCSGEVKCRILYGTHCEEITFEQYSKRRIGSLQLVDGSGIDYHLKFGDRTALDALFARRGDCDEIIIVRDGLITDTSVSNLVFLDGEGWFTPREPLLKGTCRERLLSERRILERDIPVHELSRYTGCKLISAMRDPEEEPMIPVVRISGKDIL